MFISPAISAGYNIDFTQDQIAHRCSPKMVEKADLAIRRFREYFGLVRSGGS